MTHTPPVLFTSGWCQQISGKGVGLSIDPNRDVMLVV